MVYHEDRNATGDDTDLLNSWVAKCFSGVNGVTSVDNLTTRYIGFRNKVKDFCNEEDHRVMIREDFQKKDRQGRSAIVRGTNMT